MKSISDHIDRIMEDIKKRKIKPEHVIVCESEILEVVPNAKHLLEG